MRRHTEKKGVSCQNSKDTIKKKRFAVNSRPGREGRGAHRTKGRTKISRRCRVKERTDAQTVKDVQKTKRVLTEKRGGRKERGKKKTPKVQGGTDRKKRWTDREREKKRLQKTKWVQTEKREKKRQ